MIQQPTVTIGVPVHNGAQLLHNCLECLRTQTFTNFNVIIFENQSTDTSFEIAQSFVDLDDRFSICPSDTFLNCADNFRRAIQKCSTESAYFLLRAHDDVTNPEYIQILVDALEQDKGKKLAVGRVFSVKNGTVKQERLKEWVIDKGYYTSCWRCICSVTFPASWYYGLYRGKPAADILMDSLDNFPSLWGGDRLVVMRLLTQGYIAYKPEAVFYHTPGSGSAANYMAKTTKEKIHHRIIYARMLYHCKYSRRPKSLLHNLNYSALCFRTARKHTFYRTRNILKTFFREQFTKSG